MNSTPRTMTSRVRPGAAALVLAVLLGACGGGSDEATPATSPSPTASPTSSPAATVPASPSVTPEPGQPTPSGQAVVSVYFLVGEKVQPVTRTVETPVVAAGAVRALLTGPSAAERAAGLTSSVPAGTQLLGVNVDRGLATVDLSGRYQSGGGSLSMATRLAQMVFTLTAFPIVDEVEFRLDGAPVQAFGGEGIVLDGPVDRDRFEDQAPAVLIESPLFGATVGSPLQVQGTANVFEAVFHLELQNAQGTVLGTQRVQASSGTGTRGTFSVSLTWTGPTSGPGRLLAFVLSPRDGRPENVVTIPVQFGEGGK